MGNKNSRDKYKYKHLKTSSDEYNYVEHFSSITSSPNHKDTLRNRNNQNRTGETQIELYPPAPSLYPMEPTIPQHYDNSDELLLSSVLQMIDIIIDFMIDNYRISYRLEEAVNNRQFTLPLNVNEICIMIYNIHKDTICQIYKKELVSNIYDENNIYINFIENVMFSTVNPYSKITTILESNNIVSFIEQIQLMLEPYVLIFSDDYMYVDIIIR